MCHCGMKHHEEYFIKGGDFYLKCDDILFCLHSFFLHRDSAVFRKMINTPACPNKPSCGRSESTAYEVRNATSEEFAKFCWVIYNKTYSVYDATPKEWLSILKIARKYEFDEATNCAIRGLLDGETCTMDLIRSFQELNVPSHHLIPLYAHLCRLENGPDEDDVKVIGSKVALNIFRVREHLLKALSDSNPTPVLKHVDEDDIVEAICLVFGFKKPTCKRGTVGTRRRSRVADSATSINREAFVCYDPRGHSRRSGLAGSLASLSRLSSLSAFSSWRGQSQVQRQVQQQHRRGSMRRQSQAMGATTGDVHVHVTQTQIRRGATMQDIVKGKEGVDKENQNHGDVEALDVGGEVAVQVYPGAFEEVWIEESEGGEGLRDIVAWLRFPCFSAPRLFSSSHAGLFAVSIFKCFLPVFQLGLLFYNGKFASVLSPRVTLVFVAVFWTFGLYLSTSLIPSTPIYIL